LGQAAGTNDRWRIGARSAKPQNRSTPDVRRPKEGHAAGSQGTGPTLRGRVPSAGKEATADALVATDIIHHHGPAWTRPDTSGRQGAKGFITMLRAAFPDLHAVIHDQLGEGDKVMTRNT
jgi:hypothetical protein